MHIDEIRSRLCELAMATPVIDAHTHVQDDLTGFTTRSWPPGTWPARRPRSTSRRKAWSRRASAAAAWSAAR